MTAWRYALRLSVRFASLRSAPCASVRVRGLTIGVGQEGRGGEGEESGREGGEVGKVWGEEEGWGGDEKLRVVKKREREGREGQRKWEERGRQERDESGGMGRKEEGSESEGNRSSDSVCY